MALLPKTSRVVAADHRELKLRTELETSSLPTSFYSAGRCESASREEKSSSNNTNLPGKTRLLVKQWHGCYKGNRPRFGWIWGSFHRREFLPGNVNLVKIPQLERSQSLVGNQPTTVVLLIGHSVELSCKCLLLRPHIYLLPDSGNFAKRAEENVS